jgi:hypothetical protein
VISDSSCNISRLPVVGPGSLFDPYSQPMRRPRPSSPPCACSSSALASSRPRRASVRPSPPPAHKPISSAPSPSHCSPPDHSRRGQEQRGKEGRPGARGPRALTRRRSAIEKPHDTESAVPRAVCPIGAPRGVGDTVNAFTAGRGRGSTSKCLIS